MLRLPRPYRRPRRRTLLALAALIALACVPLTAGGRSRVAPDRPAEPIAGTHRVVEEPAPPPTLGRIREAARLVVLEVPATTVLTGRVEGRTGGVRVTLVTHAQVTLATDLAAAAYGEVDRQARRAVLRLPQPTVQTTALDPQMTRVLAATRGGLWRLAVGEAHERAITRCLLAQAVPRLREAAATPDALQRARERTTAVLSNLFAPTGWSVMVEWIG